MRKRAVHVIGGGTVYHIRPQLALCSPSFGRTATRIAAAARSAWGRDHDVHLHLTRMACGGRSDIETNKDVESLLKSIVDDPDTSVVFMAASLCDYEGHVLDGPSTTDSGLYLPKLRRPDGRKVVIMDPAADLASSIRMYRKDLVLVGFRTMSGSTDEEVFESGLSMVESSSCNLVLASDFATGRGVVVSAHRWTGKEEVRTNRDELLAELVSEAHQLSAQDRAPGPAAAATA